MTQLVPHIRQDVSVRGGPMTPPWYAWAQRIDDAVSSGALTADGAAAAIKAMALALGSPDGTVEGIPPIRPAGVVMGSGSVRHAGSFADGLVTLGLDGDEDAPAPAAYYGTDAEGARGWQGIEGVETVVVDQRGNTTRLIGLDPIAVYLTDETGALMVDEAGAPILAEPPSTSQLAEGANLYYTPARADARVAAGIAALKAEADPFPVYSTAAEAQAIADAKVIDSIADGDTTRAPSRNAVFDALASKAAPPPGYIDGLVMRWVSAAALTVSSGSAYIQSAANIIPATSDIAKSGLSLAASTWFHVYFFLNAGTPDVELSTTAPAAAYSGTARSKSGDTSRRYIGSVRTDASGNLYQFRQTGSRISYLAQTDAAPFRALVNGQQTVSTSVALGALVPVTSRLAQFRLINNESGFGARVSNSDSTAPHMIAMSPSSIIAVDFVTDSSQQISYFFTGTPTTGGLFLDIYGYTYDR